MGTSSQADNSTDDGLRWYVIQTYAGYENKVTRNLLNRIAQREMQHLISDVIVPTEDEIEIKNGQRRTIQRKVYPGYVLIRMQLTDDTWYLVRNTPGVSTFVGNGNKPSPLDEQEVRTILRTMEADEPKVRVTYTVGQTVKIIDGPFTDFEGVVDSIDQDRGRVRVLVSFFGRETRVDLDFLQVTKGVE
ncbi:MAG: transcription termination/antitermination protein NusG [Roseiflexaceae bacterium]|jgi:transcriptional antiterminator NusG|nr:MAG: transcription termination/antitermination factor NusG [Chloroflexota bacterium]